MIVKQTIMNNEYFVRLVLEAYVDGSTFVLLLKSNSECRTVTHNRVVVLYSGYCYFYSSKDIQVLPPLLVPWSVLFKLFLMTTWTRVLSL